MNLRKIIQYLLIVMIASFGIAAWIASEFGLYQIFLDKGIQLSLEDSHFGQSFMQKEVIEVQGNEEILDLSGISENVTIRKTDTKEIKIKLSGNGNSFNKPRLVIKKSGVEVSVQVEYAKGGLAFNLPGNYMIEVEIPSKEIVKNMRKLKVEQISGNIMIEGLDLEQINAKSTSGNVMIVCDTQVIHMESVSGNIDLKVTHPEAYEIDASTVSGKILLNYQGAPNFGDDKKIHIDNVGSNQITAKSVSGNIDINE